MRIRLGFGTYRTVDGNADHEAALRHALAQGVPLIDTSSNYGNGKSESLVGRVLHSGAQSNTSDSGTRSNTSDSGTRSNTSHSEYDSQIVELITKLGYVQGDALQAALRRQGGGEPYPDMVVMSDSLWHCIHPEYLEDALMLSRERLQLQEGQVLDGLLLHNPEYFLAQAHQQGMSVDVARETFYERIRLAFEWLEVQVARGSIRGYGISSNTFAREIDAPDFVSLERCVQIAKALATHQVHFTSSVEDAAHSRSHNMRFAQVPFNLIEHQAATEFNQNNQTQTFLECAIENGVRVLTNRPLNSIGGDELIRLVTHDMPTHIIHPQDVEARIHALETEEHDVAQLVLMDTTLGERERAVVQETFKIAAALCQSWNKFNGIPHWRDVREAYLAPRLNAAEGFAPRASEPSRVHQYIGDVAALLDDIEWMYAGEENASLDELRLSMTDEFGLPVDTPLQHIAIHCVANTPGVDTVLIGMRETSYVDDALAALELPDMPIHRTTWLRVAEHLKRLSE